MTVFQCDKKLSNVYIVKRKTKVSSYIPLWERTGVSFYITLLEKQKHQSIPNNPWQKILGGFCSLNKLNRIAFVSWLHSFMTKTKVSRYIPLRPLYEGKWPVCIYAALMALTHGAYTRQRFALAIVSNTDAEFRKPTRTVTWYFCFSSKLRNTILLFS